MLISTSGGKQATALWVALATLGAVVLLRAGPAKTQLGTYEAVDHAKNLLDGGAHSMEAFMSSSHADLAPEKTAHDVGEEVVAEVKHEIDVVEHLDIKAMEHAAENSLEHFIEDGHEELEPEVTAHEWEEAHIEHHEEGEEGEDEDEDD